VVGVFETNQKGEKTMSEKTTATKKNGSKAPIYIAYQVRDRGEGEKGFFTRIGAAWPHGDKNGFNIQLEAVPLDGKVVLRTPSEKKE
jgi:hypothetical protein